MIGASITHSECMWMLCKQTTSKWGLCEYVIVHTILGGSPVTLWISLGGKPKWLPLKFGYHDVMRTCPIFVTVSLCTLRMHHLHSPKPLLMSTLFNVFCLSVLKLYKKLGIGLPLPLRRTKNLIGGKWIWRWLQLKGKFGGKLISHMC